MIATYRLSTHNPSFEFFSWLVMVKAKGADKIVFDISNPKLNKIKVGKPFEPVHLDMLMEKFRTIVEPGPALAGLKHRYGMDHSLLNASHVELLPWWNDGGRFQRLLTVKPPVVCSYTVTIRQYNFAKARNSNRDAWYVFAQEIGAVLIEDYLVKPIHLHDRMALYAGAKMNFGVCNGPIYTLSLTPYPVAMFVNTQSARRSYEIWGPSVGTRYPWMMAHQTMVWKDDSLDNLRRTFDELKC